MADRFKVGGLTLFNLAALGTGVGIYFILISMFPQLALLVRGRPGGTEV